MENSKSSFVITGAFKPLTSVYRLWRITRVTSSQIRLRVRKQLTVLTGTALMILVGVSIANNRLLRTLRRNDIDPDSRAFHNLVHLFQNKVVLDGAAENLVSAMTYSAYVGGLKATQTEPLRERYTSCITKLLQNNQLVHHYPTICKRLLTRQLFIRLTDIFCNFKTLVYHAPTPDSRYKNLDLTFAQNLRKRYRGASSQSQVAACYKLLVSRTLCRDGDAVTELTEKFKAFDKFVDTSLKQIFTELSIYVKEDTVKKLFRQYLLISIFQGFYKALSEDISSWEQNYGVNATTLQPAYYNFIDRRYVIVERMTDTITVSLLSNRILLNLIVNYTGTGIAQVLGDVVVDRVPKNDLYGPFSRLRDSVGYKDWLGLIHGRVFGVLYLASHMDDLPVSRMSSKAYQNHMMTEIERYAKHVPTIVTHGALRIAAIAALLYMMQSLTTTLGSAANLYRALRGPYLMLQLHYGEYYGMQILAQLEAIIRYAIFIRILLQCAMHPALKDIPVLGTLTHARAGVLYYPLLRIVSSSLFGILLRSVLITIVTNTIILWAFDEYAAWTVHFYYTYISRALGLVVYALQLYWAVSGITRVQLSSTALTGLINLKIQQAQLALTKHSYNPAAIGVMIVDLKDTVVYQPVHRYLAHKRGYVHYGITMAPYVTLLGTLGFFLFLKPWIIPFAPTEYTPVYV